MKKERLVHVFHTGRLIEFCSTRWSKLYLVDLKQNRVNKDQCINQGLNKARLVKAHSIEHLYILALKSQGGGTASEASADN
jgi:hypothetical protein